MIIGFTGTQRGMSEQQKDVFKHMLGLYDCTYLHHGDCIGADADAHRVAEVSSRSPLIIIHPPTEERKRAFCPHAHEIREPKPYLERNKDIVRECKLLLATPSSMYEELRSGTWSTVRFARKLSHWHIIIFPNGKWIEEFKPK